MIRQVLPWVTSAVTLYGMWLLGNKRSIGWVVGIANQGLWIASSIALQAWGFLPLSAALLVTYSRNLYRWRAAEKAALVSSRKDA